MIGSETFIIVAFRCRENRTPRCLASATCSARNERNAETLITVESITSPASSGNSVFSTVTVPSEPTCSMRTSRRSVDGHRLLVRCEVAANPSSRRGSGSRSTTAPIECGFFRAYSLTAFGARRSELPCRSTGLTAEPRATPYLARISFSSSV